MQPAHPTLKSAAVSLALLHGEEVVGPRLDLFIPAAPLPGAAGIAVIYSFPDFCLSPAITMQVYADLTGGNHAHLRLGEPFLLN